MFFANIVFLGSLHFLAGTEGGMTGDVRDVNDEVFVDMTLC